MKTTADDTDVCIGRVFCRWFAVKHATIRKYGVKRAEVVALYYTRKTRTAESIGERGSDRPEWQRQLWVKTEHRGPGHTQTTHTPFRWRSCQSDVEKQCYMRQLLFVRANSWTWPHAAMPSISGTGATAQHSLRRAAVIVEDFDDSQSRLGRKVRLRRLGSINHFICSGKYTGHGVIDLFFNDSSASQNCPQCNIMNAVISTLQQYLMRGYMWNKIISKLLLQRVIAAHHYFPTCSMSLKSFFNKFSTLSAAEIISVFYFTCNHGLTKYLSKIRDLADISYIACRRRFYVCLYVRRELVNPWATDYKCQRRWQDAVTVQKSSISMTKGLDGLPSKFLHPPAVSCDLNLWPFDPKIQSAHLWTQIHKRPKLGEIPFIGFWDLVFYKIFGTHRLTDSPTDRQTWKHYASDKEAPVLVAEAWKATVLLWSYTYSLATDATVRDRLLL